MVITNTVAAKPPLSLPPPLFSQTFDQTSASFITYSWKDNYLFHLDKRSNSCFIDDVQQMSSEDMLMPDFEQEDQVFISARRRSSSTHSVANQRSPAKGLDVWFFLVKIGFQSFLKRKMFWSLIQQIDFAATCTMICLKNVPL